MAFASNGEELCRMLKDKGISVKDDPKSGSDYAQAFSSVLFDAYSFVFSDIPDKSLFAMFTYPYDCHNLKTALKYAIKGENGIRYMIPLGSAFAESAEKAVMGGEKSEFPSNMAHAVKKARSEYVKRRDPQIIDLMLDHACFEDIGLALRRKNAGFMDELFRLKTDIANIYTALRLLRRGCGKRRLPPEYVFLPGGDIDASFFYGIFNRDGSEEAFVYALMHTKRSDIAYAIKSEKGDMGKTGKILEDIFIASVMRSKNVVSGYETAVRYLTLAEYEVKNLRVLVAGKKAGAKPESIIERLYECYV